MDVGVRELRDHLSQYLDRVRDGEQIVVTDRGRGVAVLTSISGERTLDRLIAEGSVVVATETRSSPRQRVVARGPISDLVPDQRR